MNLVNSLLLRRGITKYVIFLIGFLSINSLSISYLNAQDCERSEFRTIDGTCNNIIPYSKEWGTASIPLKRASGYEYAPTNAYNDILTNRPNPRFLSTSLFAQSGSKPNTKGLSSFVYIWGQFLDHDIGRSPTDKTDKAMISLPADEPLFTSDISFSRSTYSTGTGSDKPRKAINVLTSWIDGSQVYGSTTARANWLRTFNNGRLKMSRGKLLPYNTIDGEVNSPRDSLAPTMAIMDGGANPHFVTGDIRANEQPGLTSMHTLFLREHNRICEELVRQGYTDDEIIYHKARKQVGGILQAITFNEFLPALGIPLSEYQGYNPYLRPDLMNVFTTAAFRIGHTMVPEVFLLLDDNCNPVRDNLTLEAAFFNPRWIAQLGIEPFLKGISNQLQEEIDGKIVDGLRNFLFVMQQIPVSFGLDLASLNIQRGRDHGLKDYAYIRYHFTGKYIKKFSEIHSDPAVWEPIAKAYGNDINKIDPWVGMLNEAPLEGSVLGPTINFILKKQFEDIRDGDFYFYKNDPYLSSSEVSTIDNTTLAQVIQRNSDLSSLQAQVFQTKASDRCPSEQLAEDKCNGIKITRGNGAISIEGAEETAYTIKLAQIAPISSRWSFTDQCLDGCGEEKTYFDLSTGEYLITIQAEEWDAPCEKQISIVTTR